MRSPTLARDSLKQSDTRADIGINFKLSPTNQLWLKLGTGRQTADVSGAFISQATATSLNRLFGVAIFTAGGLLDRFSTIVNQEDLQLRQSIGNDAQMLTWGVEKSRAVRPGELVSTFNPARLAFLQTQSTRSTDAYLSGTWKNVGPLTIQADAWLQSIRVNRTDVNTLTLLPPFAGNFVLQNTPREQRQTDLNPRFGVTWYGSPLQSIRMVSQRWRRPASISTLGPIDTLGIPVNDRLPVAGGLYSRTRLQYDQEISGKWYVQAFADHERIDNGVNGITSIVPDLSLDQLENLRSRREVFTAVSDVEDVATFPQGIVDTVGLTANGLLGRTQSLSVRYLNRASRQVGLATSGLIIPFVPRHMLRVASQWELPERWLVGINTTYRSLRYRDAANQQLLNAGWAFGLTAYWESADKRASVQTILDNLLSDKAAGTNNKSHLTVRYTYRF